MVGSALGVNSPFTTWPFIRIGPGALWCGPIGHHRAGRLVRRFISRHAPGYLHRPFPPFRAKRVTGQFLRTELLHSVLPARGKDCIELSSKHHAPWIPDERAVGDKAAPHTPANGQLRLERSRLEGEIDRDRRTLDGLRWRTARAEDRLDLLDSLSQRAALDRPVSYSLSREMLAVSSRTSRAGTVEGMPQVVRPVIKQYPAPSGQLIDIWL